MWKHLAMYLRISQIVCAATVADKLQYIVADFKLIPEYTPIANFTVGTPPQTILGLLDTGSWDTYLIKKATKCDGTQPKPHDFDSCKIFFDNEASSTFNSSDEAGIGIWSSNEKGIWSTDVAHYGHGNDFTLHFLYVTNDTGDYTPMFGLDIYGLKKAEHGLINNLQESKAIVGRSFALYYSDTELLEGELSFGSIDHSKYTGELQKIELDSHHHFFFHNFTLKGKNSTELLLGDATLHTMFDTGGIKFQIPHQVWTQIKTELGDGSTIDCDKVRDANSVLKFYVSESNATMEFSLVDHLPDGCSKVSYLENLSTVTGGSAASGPSLWKYYYTVWDYEHMTYYVGQRNPSPGSPDIEIVQTDKDWTPKNVKA